MAWTTSRRPLSHVGGVTFGTELLLAGVFIVAGVGKLLDLPGSQRALRGFGIPEPFARLGRVALPIAELATAAALLFQPSAGWGSTAALVLLVAFMVAIVNGLARGNAPDCNCFGRLHSAPAGAGQVVRNAVLAGLAALVIVAGPGWVSDLGSAAGEASKVLALLLGASTLALLVVSVRLWRERRRLRAELGGLRRIANAVPPGLAVGALAPEFAVRGANGDTVTLHDLRSRGKPVALIFGAPGCGPCSALAPDLPRWGEALAGNVTLGLIGIHTYLRYDEAAVRNGSTLREVYESDPELAAESDELFELFDAYRLMATPAAVLVTPEGTIASATVDGKPAIEALIRLAAARRGAPGLRIAPTLAQDSPRASVV